MHIEGHTMKLEQAEAWLAALEAGSYDQTTGVLCHIDPMNGNQSFCCLGVRAKVAGARFTRSNPDALNNSEMGDMRIYVAGYGGSLNQQEMLDERWAEYHGLTLGMQGLLSRLNDGNTAWLPSNDPLAPLYKLLATKATPVADGTGREGFTFEFKKHTFAEIAKVIREHFVA